MMEGKPGGRRRVYSFQPNNVLRVLFLHKYVNYLLPAAPAKISSKRSSDVNEAKQLEKVVRFKVDLALALSAESFRWSRALKHRLYRDIQSLLTATLPKSLGCSPQTYEYDGSLITMSSTPNDKGNSKRLKKSRRVEWMKRAKRSVKGVDEDDDKYLTPRLKALGKLLPGGNEMEVCEMLSEVKSYIVCLQLQVSVLQSLVDM